MNNLITLSHGTIGDAQVQTVNARDLHAFLEVGKDFSTWIKDRIEQYRFIEGQDYSPFLGNRSDGLPGKGKTEYALTLDMAKELSMVERNEKGKQARQYFIECEKQAKQAPVNPAMLSRMQLIQIAMEAEQEKLELEAIVAKQMPKVEALDRIATSDGSLCLRDTAKALQLRPIDLTRWMQAHGWIYRRPGNANWHGYQERIQTGNLEHKLTVVSRDDGSEKIVEQVRVTSKGITRLAQAIQTDLKIMHNQFRHEEIA